MEAKLIKKNEHYFLETQPYTLSNLQRHTITANTFDKPKGHILQLSLKNCQAIERGYDLDELVEEELIDVNKKVHQDLERDGWIKIGLVKGFQKALELMGDKKYSEESLDIAFKLGWNIESEDCKENYQAYKQSLQQVEWDVEIIEECLDKDCDGVDRKGECITTGKPKLDADGCLILKRI